MRFSPSKTIFSILLLFTLFVTWLISRKLTQKTYTQTCNHSEKFHQSLHSLADRYTFIFIYLFHVNLFEQIRKLCPLIYRVHNVLTSIGLTHFLCYGSLWGQLRSSKSLPWESDIEYCLLNEEIITRDEVYLARIFRSKKMNLEYDITEGVYTITDTDFVGGKVQLIVFENDPQVSIFYLLVKL